MSFFPATKCQCLFNRAVWAETNGDRNIKHFRSFDSDIGTRFKRESVTLWHPLWHSFIERLEAVSTACGQMVIVLHTCLVLSLPLEMWISVFYYLADNETRGRDGIRTSLQTLLFCYWCKDSTAQSRWMLAYGRLKIENIPDVPSTNFSFFLWGVPQGSHHSPTVRLSIVEMSTQSRPRCAFVFPTWSGASRGSLLVLQWVFFPPSL